MPFVEGTVIYWTLELSCEEMMVGIHSGAVRIHANVSSASKFDYATSGLRCS